jgi:hypothetical protein
VESGFKEGALRRRYKERIALFHEICLHEQHEGARPFRLMSAKLHVHSPSKVQSGSVEGELFQGKNNMLGDWILHRCAL